MMRTRLGIVGIAVAGALALFVASAHGQEPKKTPDLGIQRRLGCSRCRLHVGERDTHLQGREVSDHGGWPLSRRFGRRNRRQRHQGQSTTSIKSRTSTEITQR